MTTENNIKLLNSFLQNSNKKLKNNFTKIKIAIGNEAADLDSMVSSIIYSYYLSSISDDKDIIFLPVINIPRVDFNLRTEAVYLLNSTGVDIEALVFIDEIDFDDLHKTKSLELVLVDHNVLAGEQQKFADSVVEIIDHHNDEKLYENAAKRVIKPVGSCATLIADEIFENNIDLLDMGIARLLLGTILLDTVNLDKEAGRVTDEDVNIVNKLLANSTENQDELFENLQTEKFNVESLSTRDLLRKDYKEWEMGAVKYGISSVLLPVEKWFKKDNIIEYNFSKYLKDRNLDILIAMNAYTDPDFHREIAVYSSNEKLKDKTIDCFNQNKIGLIPVNAENIKLTESIKFYIQGNLAYSRKKIQPLLNQLYSEK